MTTTLIIPGLNSSGPAHWQTWFEERIPGTVRVIQPDWQDANLANWSSRVRRDITRNPGRLVIVAHSFGVLAAAQAAHDHAERIAGALLVAPADPGKFGVDAYVPHTPLPFPSVVVGSTNDPWMALERAAYWGDLWGADFVNLGAAGHINVESGFGPWPEGLALLDRLRRAAERKSTPIRHQPAGALLERGRTRTSRFAGPIIRAGRSAVESHELKRAAALLHAAGWHVQPPVRAPHVVSM